MNDLIQLLLEAQELKGLDRAGWVRAGIKNPESVAAHSWGMAFLSLLLCPPELNRERVLALTVIHDLAEIRVGDITPHDNVSPEQKHKQESEAAADMLSSQPELLGLWEEYEAQETAEAMFVHRIDRLDMALQARVYEQQEGLDLSEFLTSARQALAGDVQLLKLLA